MQTIVQVRFLPYEQENLRGPPSPAGEHLVLILADAQKCLPREYFLNVYFGGMLDTVLYRHWGYKGEKENHTPCLQRTFWEGKKDNKQVNE